MPGSAPKPTAKSLLLRQTLTVGLHSRAYHSVSGPMSLGNCNKGFCHDQHLEVRPLWLCPQRRRSAIILPGLRRRQKSFFAFGNQKSACRKTDDQCMAMQHLRPYRKGTCSTRVLPGMRCSGSTFPSIRKGGDPDHKGKYQQTGHPGCRDCRDDCRRGGSSTIR